MEVRRELHCTPGRSHDPRGILPSLGAVPRTPRRIAAVPRTTQAVNVRLHMADVFMASPDGDAELALLAEGTLARLTALLVRRAHVGDRSDLITRQHVREATGLDTVRLLEVLECLVETGRLRERPSQSYEVVHYLDASNPTRDSLEAARADARERKARSRRKASSGRHGAVGAPQRIAQKTSRDTGRAPDWQALVAEARDAMAAEDAITRLAADPRLLIGAYAAAYRRRGQICEVVEVVKPQTHRARLSKVGALAETTRRAVAEWLVAHQAPESGVLPPAFGQRGILAGVIPSSPQQRVSPVGHETVAASLEETIDAAAAAAAALRESIPAEVRRIREADPHLPSDEVQKRARAAVWGRATALQAIVWYQSQAKTLLGRADEFIRTHWRQLVPAVEAARVYLGDDWGAYVADWESILEVAWRRRKEGHGVLPLRTLASPQQIAEWRLSRQTRRPHAQIRLVS